MFRLGNPQLRRIPYVPAIPTAAPAGTTIESAVETWVKANADRKRRPGNATIHGGAKVRRLRIVAAESVSSQGQVRSWKTPQTSR
jgi:hypothetical protein